MRKIALVALMVLMPVLPAISESLSSRALIDRDLSSGKISDDQAKIFQAMSLIKPDLLPTQYRSEIQSFDKCAMGDVRAAWEVLQKNPDQYKSYLEIMARPTTECAYQSPQGYFWIHYDTSGYHAVSLVDTNLNGIPDYVERAGTIADSVWRYEVFDLGHLPPPSDGVQGGGLNQSDIYFQRVGVYGYTSVELPGPNPWNDYSSHMVVHSTFNGFPPNQDPEGPIIGALKVTIAHEFYHVIQFAYDVGEDLFFMEESSTWMESMAFPEVKDNYNYLPYFYPFPQQGLQDMGNHMYAAFVWPKFLQERFGVAVMPSIWTDCEYNGSYTAWSHVLDTLHSSIEDEFSRFILWNYYTGIHDDGKHFQYGAEYPTVAIMRYHDNIPDSNRSSIQPPEPLGSNYIVINNYLGQHGILTIDFIGMPTADWGLAYVIDKGSSTVDSVITAMSGTSHKIFVPHFEDVLRVIFIVGISSNYGTAFNYTYHLYWRIPGDMDANNSIDISDVVMGIDYIFGHGAAPSPIEAMDANCDGFGDIGDVVYLIDYIFGGGAPPCAK